MQVLVSGSSGLIGTVLCRRLMSHGHGVTRLVRRRPGPDEAAWDPAGGTIDAGALRDHQGVVHLAGVGIGDRRWTSRRRHAIVSSRVDATALLARAVAAMGNPPQVMLSASAIGIYGDRGDEVLTEGSASGDGFVAALCRQWEAAADPVRDAGVRLAHLRSGIVLSTDGGALARQLPLFRLGLGGRLGSGRQWVSWVTIEDEVAAIAHVLEHADIDGPVNITAPSPVTNADFTRELGRAVRRPAAVPVPTIALKAVFGGELVDEVLLASQRVLPDALARSGFRFAHPDLPAALAGTLAP